MSKKINLELTLEDNPLFLKDFTEEEKQKIIEEFNKRIKDKYHIEFKKDDTVIKKGHKRKAETMKVPLDGVVLIKRTYDKKKPYEFLISETYKTHIHLPSSSMPVYFHKYPYIGESIYPYFLSYPMLLNPKTGSHPTHYL